MKRIIYYVWCAVSVAVFVGILFVLLLWASSPVWRGSSTPASSPTTGPTSTNDPGTEVVALFYKLLLQTNPPTLEQEKSVFGEEPGLRNYLITHGQGSEGDAVIFALFRA